MTSWNPREALQRFEVQPGDYAAQIVEINEVSSKTSGRDMTTVDFVLEKAKTKVREFFMHDVPFAARRMMILLDAAGLAENGDIGDLVGKRVKVTIIPGNRNNGFQPKIKRFFSLNGEASGRGKARRGRRKDVPQEPETA